MKAVSDSMMVGRMFPPNGVYDGVVVFVVVVVVCVDLLFACC